MHFEVKKYPELKLELQLFIIIEDKPWLYPSKVVGDSGAKRCPWQSKNMNRFVLKKGHVKI